MRTTALVLLACLAGCSRQPEPAPEPPAVAPVAPAPEPLVPPGANVHQCFPGEAPPSGGWPDG